MVLDRACSQIAWGNVTLFLGAGFSLGAKNLLRGDVLSGRQLKDHFLKLSRTSDPDGHYDLQAAAQAYIEAPNSNIIRELIDNFTISETSDDHRLLARHHFRRIYTTNYDDCFHKASTEIGHKCVDLDLRDHPDEATPDVNHVIHIHGKITNITKENFEKQFYLTEPNAKPIPFTVGTMATHFRNDLLASEWIIFVGYSLNDPHIKNILSDHGTSIANKTIFIGHSSDPHPLRERLAAFGHYYDIGLPGLIDRIARAPVLNKTHSAIPNNFRRIEFPQNGDSDTVSREDVRDEFLIGALPNKNFSALTLFRSVNPYYAERNHPEFNRAICIHGDTGNGKSVASKQLLYKLHQQGYRIVEYIGGDVEWSTLSRFLEVEQNVAVFIEDIVGKLEKAKNIFGVSGKNIRFVLTSKTKDWEIRRADIESSFGNDLRNWNINKLSTSEAKDTVRILNENILWGDRSGFDDDRKLFLVKETCKSEVRGLLFALFDGGSVRQRMDEIFDGIARLDKDHFDIVCLNSIFSYSRIRHKEYFSSLGNLDDLLDLRIDFSSFTEDLSKNGIKELFNAETGEFAIKSAVLSRHFLVNHLSIDELLSLSIRCLKNIENYLYTEDEFYKDLSKALLQFNLYKEIYSSSDIDSSEKLLIDNEKFHRSIHAFYDSCKEMRIAKNDPMFVIQLSKSHLNKGNFDTCFELIAAADKMFGPKGDKYQLQTHHAEVILRRRWQLDEYDDFEDERQAFEMLRGVIERRNDAYHPFGVMGILIGLVDRHFSTLVRKNCHKFDGVLEEIVRLCKRFPNDLQNRYSFVGKVQRDAERLLGKKRTSG